MTRQHGKGKKRRKGWHRGRSEAKRWGHVAWPMTGVVPEGFAAPIALRQSNNRGEAL
jgi:hypothetical protein